MVLIRKEFEKYLTNIWQKLTKGKKYDSIHDSEKIQRFL